jgi:putative membrane protein insertion efficiency factor
MTASAEIRRSLRHHAWLRRPATYLVALAVTVMFLLLDSLLAPRYQVTGRLYIAGVHFYQAVGRPLLRGHVRCRYRPSCSEYSIAAVGRYGIRPGMALTIRRIVSCTTSVPLGTLDPVPNEK